MRIEVNNKVVLLTLMLFYTFYTHSKELLLLEASKFEFDEFVYCDSENGFFISGSLKGMPCQNNVEILNDNFTKQILDNNEVAEFVGFFDLQTNHLKLLVLCGKNNISFSKISLKDENKLSLFINKINGEFYTTIDSFKNIILNFGKSLSIESIDSLNMNEVMSDFPDQINVLNILSDSNSNKLLCKISLNYEYLNNYLDDVSLLLDNEEIWFFTEEFKNKATSFLFVDLMSGIEHFNVFVFKSKIYIYVYGFINLRTDLAHIGGKGDEYGMAIMEVGKYDFFYNEIDNSIPFYSKQIFVNGDDLLLSKYDDGKSIVYNMTKNQQDSFLGEVIFIHGIKQKEFMVRKITDNYLMSIN